MPERPRLSEQLRFITGPLHSVAERSGIVARLLTGGGDLGGYALLLANLLPVYRALESSLSRRVGQNGAGRLALPEVWRVAALEKDLAALGATLMAILPESLGYAAEITRADAGDGAGLIGHAYTRVLGDLSGGQILQRLLTRSLDLPNTAQNFHHFPAIADIVAFKAQYRALLDLAGDEIADTNAALDAAKSAFAFNIALSIAVENVSYGLPSTPETVSIS